MTEQPLALRLADELKRGGMSLDNIPIIEAELRRLHQEDVDSTNTIIKLGEMLRGVVNAVRGEPPQGTAWSTHDVVELVEALKADAERYRWLRDTCDEIRSEANRIAIHCYGSEWDEAIDSAMQRSKE